MSAEASSPTAAGLSPTTSRQPTSGDKQQTMPVASDSLISPGAGHGEDSNCKGRHVEVEMDDHGLSNVPHGDMTFNYRLAYDNAQRKIRGLDAHNKRLQSENEGLRTIEGRLLKLVDETTTNGFNLEKELAKVTGFYETQQEEIADLAKTNERLVSQVQNVASKFDESQAELVSFRRKCSQLQRHLDEIKKDAYATQCQLGRARIERGQLLGNEAWYQSTLINTRQHLGAALDHVARLVEASDQATKKQLQLAQESAKFDKQITKEAWKYEEFIKKFDTSAATGPAAKPPPSNIPNTSNLILGPGRAQQSTHYERITKVKQKENKEFDRIRCLKGAELMFAGPLETKESLQEKDIHCLHTQADTFTQKYHQTKKNYHHSLQQMDKTVNKAFHDVANSPDKLLPKLAASFRGTSSEGRAKVVEKDMLGDAASINTVNDSFMEGHGIELPFDASLVGIFAQIEDENSSGQVNQPKSNVMPDTRNPYVAEKQSSKSGTESAGGSDAAKPDAQESGFPEAPRINQVSRPVDVQGQGTNMEVESVEVDNLVGGSDHDCDCCCNGFQLVDHET
ncbi:hypothetical protein Cob_v008264 [Colletotrichum orbiculare MAFF 240422]|uniref:Uncharacterized protein n=1 Tax=Colletotrichum orbiculare (strain 104-T / ATCC 96160 / CBS 514.97 / LARS 414 / MAFF 240422) TaxID=1213857 RepID=A0A484FMT8_COLOR|nr:hypothetical protein Cob_v008264 [Colletotrichum orbiculare MAFF 240422]